METNKTLIKKLSMKIKRELRKRGYWYESQNLKSPYSNSQYFEFGNLNTRQEIRISDHEYPNRQHCFRGWNFEVKYIDDNWNEFLEELDEYSI